MSTPTYGPMEAFVLPGDLIVNRVSEEANGLRLSYKLALGKVAKSAIPGIVPGDLICFALQDAKEFDVPEPCDIESGPLGTFLLREGALRFKLTAKPSQMTYVRGE